MFSSRWGLVLLSAVVAYLAVPSTAAATTTVQRIPFNATIDFCGEDITFSGDVVYIATRVELDGGGFLNQQHFQYQGVSGISSSGAHYRVAAAEELMNVFMPAVGSPYGTADTYVNHFRLIGTKGSPTYILEQHTHLTITPDATVRIYFEVSAVSCV